MYSNSNFSSPIADGNRSPTATSFQTEPEQNSKPSDNKPSFSSHVDTRERKGILPLFFERASNRMWDPSFDSKVLESEFRRFVVVVDRHRFQSGALYVSAVSLILTIYFGATRPAKNSGLQLIIGTASVSVVTFILFLLTKCTKLYHKPREAIFISLLFVLFIVIVEVVSFYRVPEADLTYASRFTLGTSIILLIYTLMPALPLYGCFLIALSFSVTHEISGGLKSERKYSAIDITTRVFLHLGIHLIGLAMFFMSQVKKRSTFWRVGQSIVAKCDLEREKGMKDRMIRWVMPKVVADWLIKDGLQRIKIRDLSEAETNVPFRPFNMDRVENVSILFADIVGFTKMSSNKSAETLVNLLNDLFGRFDELTEKNNCEKVSTLGDCYYCVAGCPEATRFHAISCVEMGLDIVVQIKKFCEETSEDVDMRVGIHTGSVLCGIVGNRRRRFDVWSNDVIIANTMEANGKPGRVHITESTLKFLEDQYEVEEGDGINLNKDNQSLNTFFIVSRKNEASGYKPWRREKAQRDSNSSLRQAIKSGLNPKNDSSGKKSKNNQNCMSPKEDRCSANDFAFHIECDDDIQAYQKQMLKQQSFSIAEDDSIELNFLERRPSGAQSPPSPKPRLRIAQNLAKTPLPFQRLNTQLNFTLNDAFMRGKIRDLNDQQLVKLMRNKETQKEYFTNPPLTKFNLNFNVETQEEKYRKECFKDFKLHPKVTTFASPKVHFFFDVVIATIMFVINTCVCYLYFKKPPVTLIVVTPIVALIMLVILVVRCFRASAMNACCPDKKCSNVTAMDLDKENSTSSQTSQSELNRPRPSITQSSVDGHIAIEIKKPKISLKDKVTSLWVKSHLYGAFMMILPIFAVFATIHDCHDSKWQREKFEFFSNLVTVVLLYFCGFTQLSYIMKSSLALAVSVTFCLVLRLESSYHCIVKPGEQERTMANDIIVSVMLLVVLVILINRLHEEGVRVNYYGDREAAEQKNNAADQKRVADSLLVDMFPRHVSEQLKNKKHCSRNYDNVGVLFATIVNFGEFYEENFAGGKECIRILHELVADFDKELDKFDDIEKIKTVHGTTFMAASGLNISNNDVDAKEKEDAHPYQHLKNLVDFNLAIFRVLDEFNSNMLGFKFLLRCGFNAGPVTAGVIGTTKPQYDIWGDTVNLASRMDSTGVPGRIQVCEKSMEMLTDFFTFEERGVVYVKGKNNMRTHLLCSRISSGHDHDDEGNSSDACNNSVPADVTMS
eukprot:gene7609-8449_t